MLSVGSDAGVLTCQVVLIPEGARQSGGTCLDKSEPVCI